jgi:hypothetical protein
MLVKIRNLIYALACNVIKQKQENKIIFKKFIELKRTTNAMCGRSGFRTSAHTAYKRYRLRNLG